jgi:hypothetical protein
VTLSFVDVSPRLLETEAVTVCTVLNVSLRAGIFGLRFLRMLSSPNDSAPAIGVRLFTVARSISIHASRGATTFRLPSRTSTSSALTGAVVARSEA